MRTALIGRIGFGLVLIGAVILVYTLHWLTPHPLVALDMPVSLSPGHIKTGTFIVNADTFYYVDIQTDTRFPIHPECQPRAVLRTRFILSSDDGQWVEQGSSPWEDTGLAIADLYSGSTRYSFDAEVLPGASCLNAFHPRLKVQTHPSASELSVASIWLAILSAGTGLVLIIRPHVGRRFNKTVVPSIFGPGSIELHPVRRGPLPRMSLPAVPFIGLLYAQISLVIVTVGLLIHGFAWEYYYQYQSPVGLFVLTALTPRMKSCSCGEAWVVRVDKKENWYLNSTKTSPQELAGLLRQQLSSQTNCAVYVDVDPSLAYQVAISAIDAIQTTQAKAVVLLRSKTKRLSKR